MSLLSRSSKTPSVGSKVCPACGALNGVAEPKCHRCGAGLGRAASGVRTLLDIPYPGTSLLFGLCLIDFVFLMLDHGGLPIAILNLGSSPSLSETLRWGGTFRDLAWFEPFRLLSASFFHFGALHLLMNGVGLLSFGRAAEERLGPARVILLFLVTGVAGWVASLYWYGPSGPPTGGASGALFGLLGQEIAQMHARKDPNTKDVLIQYVVLALAFALVVSVNNAAHLGGAVAGYFLGRLLYLERRPWRRDRWVAGLAVLGIAASVWSVVLCNQSILWQAVRAEEIQRGKR